MNVLKPATGTSLRESSVMNFLREKACAQPNLLAVEDPTACLTRGELESLSDQVAGFLRQRALNPEEPVAILVPSSSSYIVAMLGVLKAGGSYLPIDPDAPIKRLEFILRDSGCRFALTDATGLGRLRRWPGTGFDLSTIVGQSGLVADNIPESSAGPRSRAYIIYTSGSTGEPKGVEIEQHSLTNLVSAYHARFCFSEMDRAAIFSNVAFDASVADVWPMLCAGGSLHIPPCELRADPDRLIAWLAEEQITFAFVPTGLAEILFSRNWPAQMSLRFLVTGGDRLVVGPPCNLPFTVLNAYGPTENTVISTWCVLQPQNGKTQLPPIGRGIANVETYLLDERRQRILNGSAGELYLGGEQVARGYLGRPDLTAECFLPDPFSLHTGARMYRTGDWVRWLPHGELEFLGRRDAQVQIHGSRVELGEIEAALVSHPSVRQACCLPRYVNGVASDIVAYVVPPSTESELSGELRSFLGKRLPGYMLPSQFVFREVLPLTPHGKVDRHALADTNTENIATPETVADGDGLEIALSRLWHSLLPAAATSSKHAAFAHLGGDSLLTLRLMLGVEEITRQRLEVSAFLIDPTFSGLCRAVKTRMARTEFQPVLTLRKNGSRPPLFCLYQHNGDIDLYFGLVEALGDDQPVYGIRSPALENLSRLPASMEAAAADIVTCIRKIQSEGQPALVGYSWAGLLAFEVARQLKEKHKTSCFVALVGSEAPLRPTNAGLRFVRFSQNFPAWFSGLLMNPKNLRNQLSRWRELAKWAKQHLLEGRMYVPDHVVSPLSRHLIALMDQYRPSAKSDVAIDLFRERDSYQAHAHPLHTWHNGHLLDSGWNQWTQEKIRVHWIEGDHATIFKAPAVGGLAKSLRKAMDQYYQIQAREASTNQEFAAVG